MSNKNKQYDDDWNDYKKRDNRKRNHDKDRKAREFKHQPSEDSFINEMVF
jgi:hypothetical protein